MDKKKHILIIAAVLAVAVIAVLVVVLMPDSKPESTPETKALALRYDDYFDTGSQKVTILDAGTPTSHKVGSESTPDDAVITLSGSDLIATGIGTAKAQVGNVIYEITVDAAPISLFMITGHSIGAGTDGMPNFSVVGPKGQVYSSHGNMNLDPVTDSVGIGYATPAKAKDIYAFTEHGSGTKGEGSAFAWQWNNLTGEKVWVLNTAVGGSCLSTWLPDEKNYQKAVTQFQLAQAILANEIQAGHYTLSEMGIIYHNGANFSSKAPNATQKDYETWYKAMWEGFKTEMSRDMDGDGEKETVSFLGLVPIWTVSAGNTYTWDEPAGLYMAASREYPDIFTASTIGQNWLSDGDVALNFPEINYATHAGGDYRKPTSLFQIYSSDNVHYQQVAYNALGIDVANNLFSYLKGEPATSEIAIYHSTTMREVTDSENLRFGETWILSPVTDLTDLTFTVEGCIELTYPLQITGTEAGTGTLTISQGETILRQITFTCTK